MYILLFVILLTIIYFSCVKSHEYFSNYRSINYNQYFKRNRDLDYVSNRFNFKIPITQNIRTNQIAPILPIQTQNIDSLWGRVNMDFRYTNRIPDKYSTENSYIHKTI